jgi:hypothetical protein
MCCCSDNSVFLKNTGTEIMQISILFTYYVMGMWQQLFKNMGDDFKINEHLTAKCFPACVGIQEKKVDFCF